MNYDNDCMPFNIFSLKNKVAMVTGATGYLGSAIAEGLAEAGAIVIICGRNSEKLAALKLKLECNKHTVFSILFDITDSDQVVDAISEIERTHGRLDIIINNAFNGSAGTMESAVAKDYELAYKTGLIAPAMLVKEATFLLKKSGSKNNMSSVINIASMYGMVSPDPRIYGDSGHNNPPYYGPVKSGLIQYTRYAAIHLADKNIRVNSISPGAFPPLTVEKSMPELWSELSTKQPLKRIGKPEELKGITVFLASNASSYLTGVNIPVDGGWTAW